MDSFQFIRWRHISDRTFCAIIRFVTAAFGIGKRGVEAVGLVTALC
jgi:hypothetical protein